MVASGSNGVDRFIACALVALALPACVGSSPPPTGRRLATHIDRCFITDDGEIRTTESIPDRLRDALPTTAIDIDIAADHACAALATGAVACWGSMLDGKLGERARSTGRDPFFTDVGDPFIQVSVSADNSCAVTRGGDVWCWGSNSAGQLGHADPQSIGDDETAASTAPVPLAEDVVAVELVRHATCVVFADGRARCWGSDTVIVDSTRPPCATQMCAYDDCCGIVLPAEMGDLPLPEPVVALSGGLLHMCALSETGNVYCWGSDGAQLSYATTDAIESPADVGPVALGEPALEISAGRDHTCALLEGGRIKCWGSNDGGQLGLGKPGAVSGDQVAFEAAIEVGGEVLEVAAGEMQTCALLHDGIVRCWGGGNWLGIEPPEDVDCYDSMPTPDPEHGDPPTTNEFDCTNHPLCCTGDDEHPVMAESAFADPEMP